MAVPAPQDPRSRLLATFLSVAQEFTAAGGELRQLGIAHLGAALGALVASGEGKRKVIGQVEQAYGVSGGDPEGEPAAELFAPGDLVCLRGAPLSMVVERVRTVKSGQLVTCLAMSDRGFVQRVHIRGIALALWCPEALQANTRRR